MEQLINLQTQEKMETLVLNKLGFLNTDTFDPDEQYLNKDGKMNYQWNLHHFIRVGKIISNELWSIKNQISKMESTHKNIIDGTINGENTDRLQSRIRRDEDRLDNSIATLNFALAEYSMIFEDEFAREALDKVDIATNKQHNKLYKLYKDSLDQKDMVKAQSYDSLCRILTMILQVDSISTWYSTELDKRINGYQTPTANKPSKLVAKITSK